MFPEKPKNKPKNDKPSRQRIVMLLAFVILMGAIGLFIYSLPYLFPATIDLSDIQVVQIRDSWAGLSPLSPIEANYDLTMKDEGWVGEAIFSITADQIIETADIHIPIEDTDAFLDMLEQAKLLPGPYEPFYRWTDDYPFISISFQTDDGEIEIFTSSQGEGHVPWGAMVHGQEYVIESDIPMQALKILEPYMKRDILQTMIDEYQY